MFTLYDRYARELMRFGLNRANRSAAQDALQESFASIWQSRKKLANTNSPKNYLYATYRRKLVEVLKRDQPYLDENKAEVFELPVDLEPTSDVIRLQEKINELSSRQKEVIYLKYYQGMDNEEIAEILDMNYQSVRNLMSRALKALRMKLHLFIIMLIFAM